MPTDLKIVTKLTAPTTQDHPSQTSPDVPSTIRTLNGDKPALHLHPQRRGTLSAGHAFVQNLRRGHYELGVGINPRHRLTAIFTEHTRPFDRQHTGNLGCFPPTQQTSPGDVVPGPGKSGVDENQRIWITPQVGLTDRETSVRAAVRAGARSRADHSSVDRTTRSVPATQLLSPDMMARASGAPVIPPM